MYLEKKYFILYYFFENLFCLNISTTPITAMGCRQCLPLSVVQLKGKHCRKPHCRNGVVDTFRHHLLSRREFWSDFIKYRYCEKLKNFKNYPNFFWNVYMYETENYCQSKMKHHIQGLKNHLKKTLHISINFHISYHCITLHNVYPMCNFSVVLSFYSLSLQCFASIKSKTLHIYFDRTNER